MDNDWFDDVRESKFDENQEYINLNFDESEEDDFRSINKGSEYIGSGYNDGDDLESYDFESKYFYDDNSAENLGEKESVNKPRKKFKITKKRVIVSLICLSLVVILSVSMYVWSLFWVEKRYTRIDSFVNLPTPIQVDYTEDDNVTSFTVGKDRVELTFVAEYKIVGRVVSTNYYWPFSTFNKICKFDIGLVWGPISGHEYDDYIHFEHNNNRGLQFSWDLQMYLEFQFYLMDVEVLKV